MSAAAMHARRYQKIILLNAGAQTRRDFFDGCGNVPLAAYKTKEMIAYTDGIGVPQFYYENEPVDFKDAVVFTRLRATDQRFCGLLYYYFKERDIPANDRINGCFPYAEEKITQMVMLPLANIRVPPTLIARKESFTTNREAVGRLVTFPAVFKMDGSKGRNVHLVENMDDVEKRIEDIQSPKLFIVQPFIENTYDIRIVVYKGEILGAIKRIRTTHPFLNNVSQGARVEMYSPTAKESALAIHTCEVCGIDFGGVDIVHTKEGSIMFEVNKSPQIGGFESAHDFPVFKVVAQKLREEYFT